MTMTNTIHTCGICNVATMTYPGACPDCWQGATYPVKCEMRVRQLSDSMLRAYHREAQEDVHHALIWQLDGTMGHCMALDRMNAAAAEIEKRQQHCTCGEPLYGHTRETDGMCWDCFEHASSDCVD